MNSTLSTASVTFLNNPLRTQVESWFIPLDILAIICLALSIIITTIYLVIIILDKTCHTVRMMLMANVYLTGCICGYVHLAITVFTFRNDLQQIQYQDSLCIVRGYFSYASCAVLCYSYVSSAIYQYMVIVYPTRLFWVSARVQILLICLGWILAFVFPLPVTLTGNITYNVDNQICQVPLRFSLALLYIPWFVYVIPVHLVIFIYMKLVRFVRRTNQHVTPANTLRPAQRDLTVVRRIVILVQMLILGGVPMTAFIFLSFANRAPKYHFRIGLMFLYAAILSVMIMFYQFTDSLKTSMKKFLTGQRNTGYHQCR
jgi:hypothetical protein